METSQKGIDLIKEFEGFESSPYQDASPSKFWTWGYGHKRRGNEPIPTAISRKDAEELLKRDLADAELIVKKWILSTVPLTQGQFDALVSFAFNIGPGVPGVKDGLIWLKSGANSTLYRKVMKQDFAGAAEEFPKWNKAGGVVLNGLTRRRKAEQELFSSVC